MTVPPRFEVEYEDCRERDFCGNEDDQDKDFGLDSTLCFSVGAEPCKANGLDR